MAAETFTNDQIGQPQRFLLSATPANGRLVNAPPNAREFTLAPGANFTQWRDGVSAADEEAIGADFSQDEATTKTNYPLPGTRGGAKRNLNGPKLLIAGEIASQPIEITFF